MKRYKNDKNENDKILGRYMMRVIQDKDNKKFKKMKYIFF